VPLKRDDYKSHPSYNAIENMFRYMPEVTGKNTKKRAAADKARQKKERANATRLANRIPRMLVAICNQIGLPRTLTQIVAQRVGLSDVEQNKLWATRGTLFDAGLADYQVVVRKGPNAGMPAFKAIAKVSAKAANDAKAIPTAAELASNAKSGPTVTIDKAPSTFTNERVHVGKGQYSRVTTLKAGDSVKATASNK
jgi:hypothetical protein